MKVGVGPIGQALASIIRRRQGDLRMSDMELSRRARMSNSTLGTRLTGKTNLNVDELAAICLALTLDPGAAVQQAMVLAGMLAKPRAGIEQILASSDLDEAAKRDIRARLTDTRMGEDSTDS